ncbi:hypothetical protein ABW20_dc0105092 [Dactylellina cionopaga]|nr:hypothetical protein ABW20_dc0105092 [Dactylellina cionopaga]
MKHLGEYQRRIESIYERWGIWFSHKGLDAEFLGSRDLNSVVQRCLIGRSNLTNLTIAGMDMDDFIPLCHVLKASKNLRSLNLNLEFLEEEGTTLLVSTKLTAMEYLSKGGLNFDSPPPLKFLRRLYLQSFPKYDLFDEKRPNYLFSFLCKMLVFTELTFLQLRGSAEAIEIWDQLSRSPLRLKSLWLVDEVTLPQVKDLLLSFRGLTELVLDYPHEPSTVKTGLLHHSGSLEKIYWRTILWNGGDNSLFISHDDFEYLQYCTQLIQLVVTMAESVGPRCHNFHQVQSLRYPYNYVAREETKVSTQTEVSVDSPNK